MGKMGNPAENFLHTRVGMYVLTEVYILREFRERGVETPPARYATMNRLPQHKLYRRL